MKNTKIDSEILNNLTIKTISDISLLESWTEIQKILASDGAANDCFGYSVSLDGDNVVIGAPVDDALRGAAYVFTRSGTAWTEVAKLIASDGAAGDWFGYSVSLVGDSVVIGAPHDDTYRGAVYVFTRSGTVWTEVAKLVASDGEESDSFGRIVSLDGDTAAIGAYGDDSNRGAAYVFTRSGTTWTEEAKLIASDGAAGDWFGYSISVAGSTALIGAQYDDTYRGAAYVFTRSGAAWTEEAKLIASDGAAGDVFGLSVSLDGDTAAIGAPGENSACGAAYVFTRSGAAWTEEAKLTASDGASDDSFGYSISLVSDSVVIGAPYDDSNRGAAYVFTRSGAAWTEEAKLIASDGTVDDWFGYSVSLDGDTAVIGAYYDESWRGSAYIFIKHDNQPPNTPTITGPAKGKIKVATSYNFTTTDPNGDDISYYIDWGDDTNSGWIGSYPSNDVITESHIWTKKGDYMIKAKAKDIHGAESDWGALSITMPYEPQFPFIQWLLECFPNAFPLLRFLIGFIQYL